MSRAYEVQVFVKGIAPKQLQKMMTEEFGWIEDSLWEYKGIITFTGKGWLSGGQTEEEAHAQIYEALKAINPVALVSTKWTYLEDLPCSEYGDRFDINTPLPAQESAEVQAEAE